MPCPNCSANANHFTKECGLYLEDPEESDLLVSANLLGGTERGKLCLPISAGTKEALASWFAKRLAQKAIS